MFRPLLLTALSFMTMGILNAQNVKVKVCTRTTDVQPLTDQSGNDRRPLTAFYIDSIRIFEFSPKQTLFARYGADEGKQIWNDKTIVDGCQNNSSKTNCSSCSTCVLPTIKNGSEVAGTITGEMVDNVRVRAKNNDIIIEATNSKDVCYETPWVWAAGAGGKALHIKVGYHGTTTDQNTRTMNVQMSYILSSDNIERQFLNIWSGFETPTVQEIRTNFLPTSIHNLSEDVNVTILPNPVQDVLRMSLDANITGEAIVTVSDLQGRTWISEEMLLTGSKQQHEIYTNELSPGQYQMTISLGQRILSRSFTKI